MSRCGSLHLRSGKLIQCSLGQAHVVHRKGQVTCLGGHVGTDEDGVAVHWLTGWKLPEVQIADGSMFRSVSHEWIVAGTERGTLVHGGVVLMLRYRFAGRGKFLARNFITFEALLIPDVVKACIVGAFKALADADMEKTLTIKDGHTP